MTRIEIPRTAYPLAWPAGVQRTKVPRESDFHDMRDQTYQTTEARNGQWVNVTRSRKVRTTLTVASARADVQAELQRLGAAEPVVISSNMKLRLDGLPASNAPEPFDSGVAVYFVLDKRETCIAIDRYCRVADNLRAVAKTIEAMRGIERWGGASLVSAAFTGFQGLPEKSGGVGWWEVLGLSSEAPIGEIETRARTLRAQFHPDAPTADVERFNAVSQALDQARSARGVR